jgi:hypothetical protein
VTDERRALLREILRLVSSVVAEHDEEQARRHRVRMRAMRMRRDPATGRYTGGTW